MVVRYQRKKALEVMRTVNKAFKLPNPPSWHEKTRKSVANAVTGTKRLFTHSKKEAIRVS